MEYEELALSLNWLYNLQNYNKKLLALNNKIVCDITD